MSNMDKSIKRGLLASATLLTVITSGHASAQTSPDTQSRGARADSDDIVVTATRSSEVISKVPMSISAFSQEKLDSQGVKTIADIAALTPGLSYGANSARNNISIRGVFSLKGAGTTGIYIDDTPIQIYSIGAYPQDQLPIIFDLDRIEVLRGPQGTLFGSGSMGGTVRYITAQPNLTNHSVYARSELSFADGGDPSYEAGLALGGPIIEDKLGFRVSGFVRQDGGWIDRVKQDGSVVDKNSNWGRAYALRAALTWKPIEDLEITPAILYQNRYQNSGSGYPSTGTDVSWEGLSDPDSGQFNNGSAIPAPDRDRSYLYSLAARYDFGGISLISNTSYYSRKGHYVTDYTPFEADSFLRSVSTTGPAVPGIPDYLARIDIWEAKRSFVQEVRLQSDPDARLRWIVGAYYSKSRQYNYETVYSPNIEQGMLNVYGQTVEQRLGFPLLPGDISFDQTFISHDKQLAGFADVSFKLTEKLTLTAGIRKSRIKFNYDYDSDGPYNGGPKQFSGGSIESPWTPKFSVSYQADDDNLFYGTVSKGFRAGGVNSPVDENRCRADLDALGSSPGTFSSDSVMNYEIGAKNKFFGGALQVSSSAFRIDWKDIISSVRLTSCGFALTANLGKARLQGFDLQAQARLSDAISLGAAVGHNSAKYTQTVSLASGLNIATKGDHLPISPWTVTVTGDIDFNLAGQDTYIHAEYRHASGFKNLIEHNPRNVIYFQDFYHRPATNLFYLRAGVRLDEFDVSVFANNLFNANTTVDRLRTTRNSNLYFIRNVHPRVIGVTITYRK